MEAADLSKTLALTAASRHEPPVIHVLRSELEMDSASSVTAVLGRTLELPHITWRVPRASPAAREFAKRTMDIVGSLIALTIFAPVIAIVSILIVLDSKGPILFEHQRLGRGGCRFNCLKFRSMRVDAERALLDDETLRERYIANSYKIPTDDDPRVTRIGRFLRKTSLDEVPQLWNVLMGEMSLVGPRPIIDEEAVQYEATLDELLSVRPGISGAWAVRGRSRVGYPDRARLELEYVHTWTLLKDLGILLRTPWAVVTGRGVE